MGDGLQALLDESARELGVPGAVIGIVDGDQEHVLTTGVAAADTGAPVTESTLFQIGSTSKTFTGTVAMHLIENGLLELDTHVIDVLPDLRLADETAVQSLRIRHLLTHSGGFLGDADELPGWGDDALARNIATYGSLPQFFSPGTIASYSNAGMRLLGRVIEVVTGQTFEEAVQRIVLDPLGMTETFFFPWEVITRPHAVGHVPGEDGTMAPFPLWGITRDMNAEGGIVSSVGDQLRYARFHLRGETEGTAPVGEETRLRMQQPQLSAGPPVEAIGHPWLLTHHGDARVVMHGGNISDIQISEFLLAPDHDLAITVLTNSGGGKALGSRIVDWCFEHLRGVSTTSAGTELRSPDTLDELTGTYDAGQWHYDVTRVGDALEFAMVFSPQIIALGIPPRPPMRLRVRADGALITDDGQAVGRTLDPSEGGPELLHLGLRAVRRR
ncbi:serine hydrolase domain-containing protein [Microbacterium sp. TPD7012]|uniref:serine hydrolase domain-containing protein n=1 Tax=Microbacterium sp. TPD7012 TaxID=2171975 RepID=UPI000D51E0AA|nr:serine hydrolase domain-containing protein [Microbacterium sp. TPD7012]PVE93337.1 serine hydrolase [Microbacterium sp. TPD7012]